MSNEKEEPTVQQLTVDEYKAMKRQLEDLEKENRQLKNDVEFYKSRIREMYALVKPAYNYAQGDR